MRKTPAPSIEELAINRLFFDLVVPSQAPNGKRWGVDHQKVSHAVAFRSPSLSEKSSCLDSTLKAFAYANFAGRAKSAEARCLAGEYYGQALRRVGEKLNDVNAATGDDVLLSIHFLGMIEVGLIRHVLGFNPLSLLALRSPNLRRRWLRRLTYDSSSLPLRERSVWAKLWFPFPRSGSTTPVLSS